MVNEPRNLCPSCWVKDGDKELNVDDWRKYIESFLPFPIKKQLIRFEQAVRFDAYDRLMEIIRVDIKKREKEIMELKEEIKDMKNIILERNERDGMR